MTPQQLLEQATRLMNQPPVTMRRCWQRSCACLIRVALEEGLRRYWQRDKPSVAACPMRHQLLALGTFGGPDAAAVASSAWYGLSRAMHHHTYDLAPTIAELTGWCEEVAALLRRLEQAVPGPG